MKTLRVLGLGALILITAIMYAVVLGLLPIHPRPPISGPRSYDHGLTIGLTLWMVSAFLLGLAIGRIRRWRRAHPLASDAQSPVAAPSPSDLDGADDPIWSRRNWVQGETDAACAEQLIEATRSPEPRRSEA